MPKLEKLSYFVNVQVSVVPASYSAGAVTPTVVDASGGFDRVQHVVSVGAFGAGAGFDFTVYESASSGGTYTAISGASITLATASKANKIFVVDVPVNNAKPFQKLIATATTQAVAVCAIANCYNGTRSLGTALADVAEEVNV